MSADGKSVLKNIDWCFLRRRYSRKSISQLSLADRWRADVPNSDLYALSRKRAVKHDHVTDLIWTASTEDVDLTGYARFADLLCEPRYQNFRSFKYLRVRMLLRQQRILDHLETQLRSLDNFDARFHNTWTHDPDKDLNEEREALFVRLGVELQVFGAYK